MHTSHQLIQLRCESAPCEPSLPALLHQLAQVSSALLQLPDKWVYKMVVNGSYAVSAGTLQQADGHPCCSRHWWRKTVLAAFPSLVLWLG